MNHANTQHASKQHNKTVEASKPVSINHASSVKEVLQPKLKIGRPNDKYEQEADQVAERVMRMPEPASSSDDTSSSNITPIQQHAIVQRSCANCREENELIQKKALPVSTPEVNATLNSNIQSLHGRGQPLDSATRSFFEPRFGYNFNQVRLHSDTTAANTAKSINAHAFTLGNHVVMGSGEYHASSPSSQRLLAHELTHVVQQNPQKGKYTSSNNINFLTPLSPKVTTTQAGSIASDTLQRACGSSEIGPTPPTCNLVSKTPTGRRFLFNNRCDTFDTGQRTLLEGFIHALPAGAKVDILGLASSDGRTDFNESLSCKRADATEAVFAAEGRLGSISHKQATGEVPGSDNDGNFRAVDIEVNTTIPDPPTPTPPLPEPVPPPPSIPVAGCNCPPSTPSCLPGFCMAVPAFIAREERRRTGIPLIAVLTGLGGLGVGSIYHDFVFGGRAGVMTLSSSLRNEFASICQTEVATHHIMSAIINSIWGVLPATTPAGIIPLTTVAGTAVSDIGTPGNANQLVYCGSTNAPGLLAGGIGTTQLSTRVGAIPSTQNDSRTASGIILVTHHSLPSGGTKIEFTPSVNIEVRDTVDFCPGNCGSLAAQVATNPLSRWESSGISGDVAFVTQFSAPRSQLRKIVLETVGGTSRWSLQTI